MFINYQILFIAKTAKPVDRIFALNLQIVQLLYTASIK